MDQQKGLTMRLATIFPLLTLLAAAPVEAAMFKWTDADGNIQYGQHPPAGAKAEQIRAAPAPKSAPVAKPPQQQVEELDKRLDAQQQQKAEAEEKKQAMENRKINCANARKNLEQLSYGGHRLMHMPDGSYQRLDEEQKQALVKKNQDAVKEFCD
jgi:hypothetical protein